jgi:isopentenyl-diphosphate delta-isomerase
MDFMQFESRKADHLRLALHDSNQTLGQAGFDKIHLSHEALPELNFRDIELRSSFWNYRAASPFFISSMTAGHQGGEMLNIVLARVAAQKKWPMGLGSQRRELTDRDAPQEWRRLRQAAPDALFFSNLGLAQLIQSPTEDVIRLIHSLESAAIIIHLNALQECIQPEGTPNFAGGEKALENLCKKSPVPVIVKETGCGFSQSTLERLFHLGIAAVDISGRGGTHWGRIEGARALSETQKKSALASQTFANWGESTVPSLLQAVEVRKKTEKAVEIWASGGIRNGLDAAKAIAMGANKVGFAKPALVAALEGEHALAEWMDLLEHELKVALFCTGSRIPEDLQKGQKWQKI